MKDPGNKIHVNIRYPAHSDFEIKSVADKNRIRLDIIHTALLRAADYDKKLDPDKLEQIKDKILKNNFSFEFIYKSVVYKRKPEFVCNMIIEPLIDKFVFYAVVERNAKVVCRLKYFEGIPGDFYVYKYFRYGKWKGDNEFIISGKESTVETRLFINECIVNVVNLTAYENPPFYTLMKAGLSEEEKEKAGKDWEHSLPPAVAALLRDARN